jgi:hypothetical protein
LPVPEQADTVLLLDGTYVLIGCTYDYQAAAGMAMRRMACMGCGLALAGGPFILLALLDTEPCLKAGSHLPAIGGAFHAACEPDGDEAIVTAILARTTGCFE